MARSLAWEWLTLRLLIGILRRVVAMISPSTVGLLAPLDWASQLVWGLRAYRRGLARG
jgi:hypothetical protein